MLFIPFKRKKIRIEWASSLMHYPLIRSTILSFPPCQAPTILMIMNYFNQQSIWILFNFRSIKPLALLLWIKMRTFRFKVFTSHFPFYEPLFHQIETSCQALEMINTKAWVLNYLLTYCLTLFSVRCSILWESRKE